MTTLDQVVKLLSLTDGRDKTYKFLQGASKALSFYATDKAVSHKFDALAKSIGEGRSIMRFAKWTTNIQKLQGLLGKAEKAGGWTQLLIIEALRVLGDMGYVVGDNLSYFAKYKMIALDAKQCTKYGKITQFWGFFCQVILDVVTLVSLDPAKEGYAEARESAILNLTKNTADLLVVLDTVGYLPKTVFGPNAGMLGLLLALSGGISTYQNWGKAAPEKKKDEKKTA